MTGNQDAVYAHRVRALERGLNILVILNQFNGLSMPELLAKTNMARSAMYRVLTTLIEADYVFKSPSDNLYRVTSKVRDLSAGYQENEWFKKVAEPILGQAADGLAWPLSLVVLRNRQLVTVANTDRDSPLIVRRIAAGTAMPVLGTASGLVFLTFGDPELAALLKRSALAAEQSLMQEDDIDVDTLDRCVSESHARGFCIYDASSYRALAVPVYAKDGSLFAALSVRSSRDTPWPPEQDEKYLNILMETATRLQGAMVS